MKQCPLIESGLSIKAARVINNMGCNMNRLFVLAFFFALFFKSDSAYAYLDPGSMSLFLQAVVAGIAGAALTWKRWFWRVLSFFGIKTRREKPNND